MSYYTKTEFEHYIGQEIGSIVYLYPMGTSGKDGRYQAVYEEILLAGITDTCLILTEEKNYTSEERKGDKFLVTHLIPIEQIVACYFYKDVK